MQFSHHLRRLRRPTTCEQPPQSRTPHTPYVSFSSLTSTGTVTDDNTAVNMWRLALYLAARAAASHVCTCAGADNSAQAPAMRA